MAASKVFTAVLAESLSPAERSITAAQLRLLVVLDGQGTTNLSGLADRLGVDPSTASRTCDQLVKSGLVARHPDPLDRRQVNLQLSRRGAGLLTRIMTRRRAVLGRVTAEMSDADTQRLVQSLTEFVRAAGVVLDPALALGVDPALQE